MWESSSKYIFVMGKNVPSLFLRWSLIMLMILCFQVIRQSSLQHESWEYHLLSAAASQEILFHPHELQGKILSTRSKADRVGPYRHDKLILRHCVEEEWYLYDVNKDRFSLIKDIARKLLCCATLSLVSVKHWSMSSQTLIVLRIWQLVRFEIKLEHLWLLLRMSSLILVFYSSGKIVRNKECRTGVNLTPSSSINLANHSITLQYSSKVPPLQSSFSHAGFRRIPNLTQFEETHNESCREGPKTSHDLGKE